MNAESSPLSDLMGAGWRFAQVVVDGEMTQLNGVRTWPESDWADGLIILPTAEAKALRTDADGGIVWQRTGTLTEVAAELLALPHPDERGAPRLVRGTVPSLWTP